MSIRFDVSLRRLGSLAFGVVLLALAGAAGAVVLYEQAPVGGGVGFYANPNFPQQLAEDFALGGAVSLERIAWWGGYDAFNGLGDQGDDDFLVRIYSDVSGTGTPLREFGSVPYTRTATALVDVVGNAVYQYEFDLATAIDLSADTFYLFVQNLGSSDWFWQAASGNGTVWYRSEDTDPWGDAPYGVAFRLTGSPVQVPAPGTMLLLLAGAALLPVRRRRHACRP